MISIILAMLSFSVIYFIRLLFKRNMKTGAIALGVFYVVMVAWAFLIFELDAAHLGVHGSSSLLSVSSLSRGVPEQALPAVKAVIAYASMAFVMSAIAFIHSLFEITRAVIKAFRKNRSLLTVPGPKGDHFISNEVIFDASFLRLYCRMNC